MNIYLHELKSYRQSTITWCISLSGVIFALFALFPTLYDQGQAFERILQGFPDVVRQAFGMAVGFMTSFLGLYAFSFLYILLCGATQAMMLGLSVVSKETTGKTADFLLSKPVTRAQILTAKALAVLTSILITNGVFVAVVSVAAPIFAPTSYDVTRFYLMTLTLFLVQLMFVALGFLISACARKIKAVLAVSLGTVFAFYIVGSLGAIIGEESARYLSPFKYFDYSRIILTGSLEISYLIVEAVFVAAAVFVSYWVYLKKDIHAV